MSAKYADTEIKMQRRKTMKKTLSILMILAMLFSMVIAAIPTGAATDANVTELDPDKVGNVVITNDKREDYFEELFDQGYIALVNEVFPEYQEEFGDKVRAFADIFEGGSEDIADGGKFFLVEDIIVSKTFNSKANTAEGNKKA
jgi:hypothetical protein